MFTKFKKHDPEAILRSGQVRRRETIETMLSQHGFEAIDGGDDSHFWYINKECNLRVGLVEGTNNIIYQQKAAEACLRANEIKGELLKQKLQAVQVAPTESPTSDFLPITQHRIPEDIEIVRIEGFDDCVSLRIKSSPEMGLIAPAKLVQAEVDRLAKKLFEKADEFKQKLEQAVAEYELTTYRTDSGALRIESKWYSFYDEFPSFEPESSYNNVQDRLRSFILYVQNFDRIFSGSKGWIKEQESELKSEPIPEGGTRWKFEISNIITGEELTLFLATSPKSRTTPASEMIIFQNMFQLKTGMSDGSHGFKQMLNEYLGFDVKKHGNKLVCSHPFFPECKFDVPVLWEVPNLVSIWDSYMREQNIERQMELFDQLCDVLVIQNNIIKAIDINAGDFILRLQDMTSRAAIFMQQLEMIDNLNTSSRDRTNQYGRQYTLSFQHPYFERPLHIRYMNLNGADIKSKARIPHPQDLENGIQILNRALQKCHNGSSQNFDIFSW